MTDIAPLVSLIILRNDVAARQWVKDRKQEAIDWSSLKFRAENSSALEFALAAALTELFCTRYESKIPSWTKDAKATIKPYYVDPIWLSSDKLRKYFENNSPEPFKKRNLFTYSDYLNVI